MEKEAFHKLSVAKIQAMYQSCDVDAIYMEWGLTDSRKSVRESAQRAIKKKEDIIREKNRIRGLYRYEEIFYNKGQYLVAGVDEVGRGPIAGPVTVAAVILPPYSELLGLNDSKKVPAKRREALYEEIMEMALAVSCVSYSAEIIDSINIYEATKKAMYEVIDSLKIRPEGVLVDAMPLSNLSIPNMSLIKGDSMSASIAAASIVAKVVRDRYMLEMDAEYPKYAFKSHKGYGTKEHMQAIFKYGITKEHRRTFEPVASYVKTHKE